MPPVPTQDVHTRRSTCRACGGSRLTAFLPLGETALANSFLRDESEIEAERRFPLEVYLCEDCGLVQIVDVIDPELLFRNYIYVTGTSDTIAAHNVGYARSIVEMLSLGPEDLVVEVASNDGSLLLRYQDHGVRTLGIEPATNIAEQARAAGVETVNEFFSTSCAQGVRAEHGPAKIVCGNNVLAHVDDPLDFLRGARELLCDDGLVVIEAPYIREFIERFEYDTVYHEHLCYLSVTALARMCEEVGLRIVRVDRVPVHGGSIRMHACRVEHRPDHGDGPKAMMKQEQDDGLTSLVRMREFAEGVARNREQVRGMLQELKDEGKTVAGYGAPAKGNTLLNYCDIGTDLLPYTVDKSPHKVGLLTPGSHIPVLPTETLLERQPDYVFILAWNFADEIMSQQAEYARRGGRFIVPIPEPRVLEPQS